MRARSSLALGVGLTILIYGCAGGGSTRTFTKASVGALIFSDASMSNPTGQSCATCHDPAVAFADPRLGSPTSEGAVKGLFGARQAPALTYVKFSPDFKVDAASGLAFGGQFWDGRAVDLKDQVHFPLLSAAEMNLANKGEVVDRVKVGPGGEGLRALYGKDIFKDRSYAFEAIAECLAEFESSAEFTPFSSKFDAFLKGETTLSLAEQRGLNLFNGKALCFTCHPSAVGPKGEAPLFTDFSYHNIGVPKNPANPFYAMPPEINPAGAGFIDRGLFQTTRDPRHEGLMKTPSLRNIARTAPYFHNGVFSDLESSLRFYNARDLGGFGPPEVVANVNRTHMGNLKLTDADIADLAEFLKTLSDGWR